MGQPVNITVSSQGPVLRLAVEGELDLTAAPDLLAALEAVAEADVAFIDVDLSGVGFLDSTCIEVLVRAQRFISAREEPCRLRVVRPSGVAGAVLRACGVHGYLEVVDEAIPELTET